MHDGRGLHKAQDTKDHLTDLALSVVPSPDRAPSFAHAHHTRPGAHGLEVIYTAEAKLCNKWLLHTALSSTQVTVSSRAINACAEPAIPVRADLETAAYDLVRTSRAGARHAA
ncbi:hypothetical protein HPB50_025791 [Hyalomma asiaticum]|uniref:Uncharacterized protein n=1 Tax=Hyalomma asiaticum TaxID=266040 RepID=A0ACB7SRB2_HYAAI|nr:hypothetical protein HPB50_025791 [Hyalomma asiaticum]